MFRKGGTPTRNGFDLASIGFELGSDWVRIGFELGSLYVKKTDVLGGDAFVSR